MGNPCPEPQYQPVSVQIYKLSTYMNMANVLFEVGATLSK